MNAPPCRLSAADSAGTLGKYGGGGQKNWWGRTLVFVQEVDGGGVRGGMVHGRGRTHLGIGLTRIRMGDGR